MTSSKSGMTIAAVVLSATMTLVSASAAAQSTGTKASSRLIAGKGIATVETTSARVQGFVRNGISTFRGVPYATAERFQSPKRALKAAETFEAINYGAFCPQIVDPPRGEGFSSEWRYWPQAENCLNLNVWTPAADKRKRPVLVWLHGGGYSAGSSIEQPYYDGENLSRKGDAVVVSINHRLNVLGFLDLSAFGDAYKFSGNAGIEDLVVALEWVRDNVQQFGGDPNNVTIFGQSGGGGKVLTLMAAPRAAGLFDKAVVMSGAAASNALGVVDQKTARRVAELTFKHAGLKTGDVKALSAIPYAQLSEAAKLAAADAAKELGRPSGPFGGIGWAPVEDGVFLKDAWAHGAPQQSRNIPMMIGSTLSEFQLVNPQTHGRRSWSPVQTSAALRSIYGDRTDAIVAAYRKAYPNWPLSELPAVDSMFRKGTVAVAKLKAQQPAPVYNYLFAWRSPLRDGSWAAGHTGDVPFFFNNAELGITASGGGPEVDGVTAVASQALINFARAGDPNGGNVPSWPRLTSDQPATLVIDAKPWVGVGHDEELISLLPAPRLP